MLYLPYYEMPLHVYGNETSQFFKLDPPSLQACCSVALVKCMYYLPYYETPSHVYGNETSQYFELDPPSLQDYFV